MSLMERLVMVERKCVEEVALALQSMNVGGSLYLTEEDKIERRADGYYYVNDRTKAEWPVEPALAAYLFLSQAANVAVKRFYGQAGGQR